MSEVDTAVIAESPEAELPLSEFVKRGNLRDRGQDVPEIEPAEPVAAAADVEDEPEPPPVAATSEKVEPPKVDKRTREGRKASIRAEIDELTAQKHQTAQEFEATRQQVQALRAELAALQEQRKQAVPPPPSPPPAPAAPATSEAAYKRYMAHPNAPKESDFTGPDAYRDWQYAVSQFVADQRFAELSTQQRQRDAFTQTAETFKAKISAEVTKRPELQEKLNQGQIDSRIMPYLFRHPMGADVMVYLAENPSVAQQLSMLNPYQTPQPTAEQIGQIGEIAGLLKARADAVSRGPARMQVSKAQPPIKPLGSSPTVSDDDDGTEDENLPLAQFVRKGNARDPRINPRAARR